MSKRRTFEAEDVKAIDRAEQHSNQLDRDGSQEAQPEMGFHGVPDEKIAAGASQISQVGRTLSPGRNNRKKKKLNPDQQRAHDYTVRSENGNAEKEGGY